MIPEFWIWNHKFRVAGVLSAVAFHAVMFAPLVLGSDAQADGYRWLFAWYMPSAVLGFPWSIAAIVIGALIPDFSVLGVMLAVCFNGYLLGWPVDAIVNHARRERQCRVIESYL